MSFWKKVFGAKQSPKVDTSLQPTLPQEHSVEASPANRPLAEQTILSWFAATYPGSTKMNQDDVHRKDKTGSTSLHRAALAGREDVVEFLIAKGADIDVRNKRGETPLHCAAAHLSVTALLFASGAKVNAKTDAGYTALHFAVSANRVKVVALLIENGADVNAQEYQGQTPLHLAFMKGHDSIKNILLTSGANVKLRDRVGYTPVVYRPSKD